MREVARNFPAVARDNPRIEQVEIKNAAAESTLSVQEATLYIFTTLISLGRGTFPPDGLGRLKRGRHKYSVH